MISIVTPWIGHPELIEKYEPTVKGAQVVVVQNDGDADLAAALTDMTTRLGNGSLTIPLGCNRYFSRANNVGYEMATENVIVFMNNDVTATGEWLPAVERDVKDEALYGPGMAAYPVQNMLLAYVEGWCIAGTDASWKRICVPTGRESQPQAPWDEITYPRCYAEDMDLCFRARKLGMNLMRTFWTLKHEIGYTNKTLPGAFDAADANRATFEKSVKAYFDVGVQA